MSTPDPDRFVNFSTPGSQEWWYFDAISRDARDALVLIWYAGLPFDPAYGVAAIRHARNPERHAPPHPLDHSAFGLSWYRDGKPLAYALNAFPRDAFAHDPSSDSFRLDIDGNTIERRDHTYHLQVDTPAVDGRSRLRASLTFTPAPGTEPIERELGSARSTHLWILAAPDCHVSGTVAHDGRKPSRTLDFDGRGYHDHNAGSEEISLAMRRWAWGRVHLGPLTHVYYHAAPHAGPASGVWMTLRDGRPEQVRDDATFRDLDRAGNVFGVRHGRAFEITQGGHTLTDHRDHCVDDGPFYRRWVASFRSDDHPDPALGISEILDTRNLNRPLFNWMIPFRLKRPASRRPV